MADNSGLEGIEDFGKLLEGPVPIEGAKQTPETGGTKSIGKEELEGEFLADVDKAARQNEEYMDLVKGRDYFVIDEEGNRVVEELNGIDKELTELKSERESERDYTISRIVLGDARTDAYIDRERKIYISPELSPLEQKALETFVRYSSIGGFQIEWGGPRYYAESKKITPEHGEPFWHFRAFEHSIRPGQSSPGFQAKEGPEDIVLTESQISGLANLHAVAGTTPPRREFIDVEKAEQEYKRNSEICKRFTLFQ